MNWPFWRIFLIYIKTPELKFLPLVELGPWFFALPGSPFRSTASNDFSRQWWHFGGGFWRWGIQWTKSQEFWYHQCRQIGSRKKRFFFVKIINWFLGMVGETWAQQNVFFFWTSPLIPLFRIGQRPICVKIAMNKYSNKAQKVIGKAPCEI